jgi:hypothetical protein
MIKGKWSVDWIRIYNKLTNSTNGLQWCTTMLKQIWIEYHLIWTHRNKILHEPTNAFEINRQNEMLNKTIQETYALTTHIPAHDRRRLLTPLDKLLNSTRKHKHLWINTNSKDIRNKAKNNTPNQNENRITKYFQSRRNRKLTKKNTTIASEYHPP